jgi:hypothetical protein
LESFFSQVILDSQNLQCVYRSQHWYLSWKFIL